MSDWHRDTGFLGTREVSIPYCQALGFGLTGGVQGLRQKLTCFGCFIPVWAICSFGCGSKPMGSHFGVGEFTTHFRLDFSGGLGCSLGVRDFDPWPGGTTKQHAWAVPYPYRTAGSWDPLHLGQLWGISRNSLVQVLQKCLCPRSEGRKWTCLSHNQIIFQPHASKLKHIKQIKQTESNQIKHQIKDPD